MPVLHPFEIIFESMKIKSMSYHIVNYREYAYLNGRDPNLFFSDC